jgi:hypothetical protein
MNSDLDRQAGPTYVAQGASGLVFNVHRLTAGAIGVIVAGLLTGANTGIQVLAAKGSAPLGLTVPLGVILVICAAITVACTNAIVARSVVTEIVENRHQTLGEGFAFVRANITTILLYPLAFLGLILAANLAMGLLTFISAIPVVGNVLYGLILFPICLFLAIAALVLALIFGVTAFVFPGHVAVEQASVGSTIRDLIRLARSRWASLIGSQLIAVIAALCLGAILLVIGMTGVISGVSLWGVVQLSSRIYRFDLDDLPRLLMEIGQEGDAAAFGAGMVAFWLAIFGLALLSFLPTYMSTAGALVYLTALGKTQASSAPVLSQSQSQSQSPAPTTAFSAVTLEDIGGAAGGRSVAVLAQGIRIGRGQDCDVVVNSEYVSSAHVLIVPIEGGRLSVQDLKSTNGTFVNDARITTADVGAGDVIRLGSDPNARFTIRA